MKIGLPIAVILQTLLTFAFVGVLEPFRFSVKKSVFCLGSATLVLSGIAGGLASVYGSGFLYQYGFMLISMPLFIIFYLVSRARGIRYIFIVLTALIFHKILASQLMVFRVWVGGFTLSYFALNCIAFGMLLAGGCMLRRDFHKVVFTYRSEFICLSAILLLLYVLLWAVDPVVDGVVDPDLLLFSLVLDLLLVLLFVYIGVTFHSLGKFCGQTRDAVSYQLQLEEAQNHIALLRSSQEKASYYRHDLRHHLIIMQGFLEKGELDELKRYVNEVQRNVEEDVPARYCQNEVINLLLVSFTTAAEKARVMFYPDVQLPQILPVGNAELCTLLSNGLENAIRAASLVKEDRVVRLTAKIIEEKLLIMIQNPFIGEVHMVDGFPQSSEKGHGLGVKSMETVVRKYNGLSTYEAKDQIFTVRIVIGFSSGIPSN